MGSAFDIAGRGVAEPDAVLRSVKLLSGADRACGCPGRYQRLMSFKIAVEGSESHSAAKPARLCSMRRSGPAIHCLLLPHKGHLLDL